MKRVDINEVKIGELTFWYSKCEKGIYRIESNEH